MIPIWEKELRKIAQIDALPYLFVFHPFDTIAQRNCNLFHDSLDVYGVSPFDSVLLHMVLKYFYGLHESQFNIIF